MLHPWPDHWDQSQLMLPTAKVMLTKSLYSFLLKGVPATTWFLPIPGWFPQWPTGCRAISLAPLSSSPSCSPGSFPLGLCLMIKCTDLSDVFVCWKGYPLLNYSCSSCWNFKGRDLGGSLTLPFLWHYRLLILKLLFLTYSFDAISFPLCTPFTAFYTFLISGIFILILFKIY